VSDFTYLGAFKAPTNWENASDTFEYSLAGIAYNPAGNGGAGSLIAAGHSSYSKVAEITIPALSTNPNPVLLNESIYLGTHYLNPASVTGPTGQMISTICRNPEDGLFYYILETDYETDVYGIGRFDVSRATPAGRWQLQAINPYNSLRNIFYVPPAWQAANAPGYSMGTLRYRQSFSRGPNCHLFKPPVSLPPDSVIPSTDVKTVALWDAEGGSTQYADHNSRTNYFGAHWIVSPSGKTAFVVCGIRHYNKPAHRFPDGYYGYENAVLPDECEPFGTCVGQRGHRCADGRFAFWLWDPAEYAQVIAGTKQPFQVSHYAFSDVVNTKMYNKPPENYLMSGYDAERSKIAYDPAGGRLFASECYVNCGASSPSPVIHVWGVA
jgi:hypothetical protein